jgi:ABC-type transport system substrate-binding protein
VPGHDDALDVATKYDPAAARSLLDKFGYVDRNGDGWRDLPDGLERNRLYRAMSELVAAYNPWLLHVYTVETTLAQPWVRGYKKHAYWEHPWLYIGVDNAQLAAR